MPSRRLLKAAEAIREVVGMAILADLQDPRIRDVTVTGVEVAPDMRQAKVYVSVMGSESKQNLSLLGLQSAAGFLQSKVARRIDTRYTPKLTFVLDQGVKKQIEVSQILGRVLGEERAGDPAYADGIAAAEQNDAPDDQRENDLEEQPPGDSGEPSR
jgi:ribosome-binding factor A